MSMYAGCRGVWEVGVRILPSLAYAGNHGCPSSAVVCYGGWIKQWRNVQRVFSEALAKKDMLPAFVAELLRRSNSAGFAEDTRGTTAVKPWGSTHCGGNLCARSYTMVARDAFLDGNGSTRLKNIPGPLNRA